MYVCACRLFCSFNNGVPAMHALHSVHSEKGLEK